MPGIRGSSRNKICCIFGTLLMLKQPKNCSSKEGEGGRERVTPPFTHFLFFKPETKVDFFFLFVQRHHSNPFQSPNFSWLASPPPQPRQCHSIVDVEILCLCRNPAEPHPSLPNSNRKGVSEGAKITWYCLWVDLKIVPHLVAGEGGAAPRFLRCSSNWKHLMPVSNVRFSMSSNSHVLADGKVRHAMWPSRHVWASKALAVILKPVSHKEHLGIVTLSFLGLDDISLGITNVRSQVEVRGARWKEGPSSAQTIYVSDGTVLCLISPPCTIYLPFPRTEWVQVVQSGNWLQGNQASK